jgi:hypothetical protein
MELFNEVKNRYFHIVLAVLNQCEEGLSKEDIIKIVDKEAFQEKLIGKDFQTFEGLLLNEYEDKENYNLLKFKHGLFYPNSRVDNKPPIPVRLTNIEKAWLKNLLQEPNLSLFLSDSTIDKLREALREFQAPSTREIIEATNKSMLPELSDIKQYEANFRTLLKAILEEKPIKYCNVDRFGTEYCGKSSLPLRLEYSLKDGRFRVSMYSLDDKRHIMAKVGTLKEIKIEDNKELEMDREAAIKLLHEDRYSKEPIVLEVTDKKGAMERCFMSFSEIERGSRCICEDKYELKLSYYSFEEEEVIRKILALGPYVKVISPQRIVEEVVNRIKKALKLNGGDLKIK